MFLKDHSFLSINTRFHTRNLQETTRKRVHYLQFSDINNNMTYLISRDYSSLLSYKDKGFDRKGWMNKRFSENFNTFGGIYTKKIYFKRKRSDEH